jgi:peroxiredoxin
MTDSEHFSSPQLEKGQIIPAFTLPGTDGMPHGPWDYKQREHLIVVFTRSVTTDAERELVRAFATHYTEFRQEYCAILGITAEAVITNLHMQEQLHLPFPLLADPTGRIIQRYTAWEATTHAVKPCIILADRYNALYEQWSTDNEVDLPSVQELLETLQYMNKLCAL